MNNEINFLNAQMEAAKEREFQALQRGLYMASDYWVEVQQEIQKKLDAIS